MVKNVLGKKRKKNAKLKECVFNVFALEEYLTDKGSGHKSYKTYSTLERIQSWKDSDCFYLDDGSRWNDPYDRDMFNNDECIEKRFGRCFSFSTQESVAMWMLYCGTENNGAMLEFSGAAMRELIRKQESVDLGKWENGKFKVIKTLEKDEYTLELRDILYKDKVKALEYCIERADEKCSNVPAKTIDHLAHCVKLFAWGYENECRLILSVKKNAVPEAAEASSVRIRLYGMLEAGKKVNIYHSPKFEGKPTYQESELKGGLDWDLCSGCKKIAPQTTQKSQAVVG